MGERIWRKIVARKAEKIKKIKKKNYKKQKNNTNFFPQLKKLCFIFFIQKKIGKKIIKKAEKKSPTKKNMKKEIQANPFFLSSFLFLQLLHYIILTKRL